MNFCVRPSKSFLFDILEKRLKKITHGVGLDAASASFKNRRMFKTDFYYGLDNNLSLLQKGVKQNKLDNILGIYGDLTNLDLLPNNSIDVVVSTNTLHCLPPDKRIIAIDSLCRLVSPAGYFFCGLPIDKDLEKTMAIIKARFNNIKIIYYCSIFSRFYEWIFEKDGYLGSHPIAGLKLFRLFAWLISRLEYLTCHFKFLNKHSFIICTNKKDSNKKNAFKLSHLSLVEERIYNLMN